MDGFFPLLASDLGKALLPARDVVLIELRGLLYSQPDLICDEVNETQIDLLAQNLSYEESKAVSMEALRASRDRFLRQGMDLSAYNNVETAADINLVMASLGYDKFNMVGYRS